MLLNEFHESRKVRRVSIDITHEEGGPSATKSNIFHEGSDDAVCLGGFGGVVVAATVSIRVAPVAEPSGLALAMGDKLGTTKLDEGGQALGSRLKGKEGIRSHDDSTHSSAWLDAIGVWNCEDELLVVLVFELPLKSVHSSCGSAALLKEREVSWLVRKALSMTLKVGTWFQLL